MHSLLDGGLSCGDLQNSISFLLALLINGFKVCLLRTVLVLLQFVLGRILIIVILLFTLIIEGGKEVDEFFEAFKLLLFQGCVIDIINIDRAGVLITSGAFILILTISGPLDVDLDLIIAIGQSVVNGKLPVPTLEIGNMR